MNMLDHEIPPRINAINRALASDNYAVACGWARQLSKIFEAMADKLEDLLFKTCPKCGSRAEVCRECMFPEISEPCELTPMPGHCYYCTRHRKFVCGYR